MWPGWLEPRRCGKPWPIVLAVVSELKSSRAREAVVQTLDPTLSVDQRGLSADSGSSQMRSEGRRTT